MEFSRTLVNLNKPQSLTGSAGMLCYTVGNYMKWILIEHKLPYDGQCCHVVFDHDDAGDTAIWWAQYKEGKWIGVDLPGNEEQELIGKAICWMPEPENPFATHQDV